MVEIVAFTNFVQSNDVAERNVTCNDNFQKRWHNADMKIFSCQHLSKQTQNCRVTFTYNGASSMKIISCRLQRRLGATGGNEGQLVVMRVTKMLPFPIRYAMSVI